MEQTSWLKYIKRSVLVAAVFLLQFIFADHLRLFGVAPNFAFCFVLTISFLKKAKFSFYTALILGVLLDSVSGRLFGTYTVFFMLLAFGIREFYHSAFSENFVIEALFGLLVCFLYSVSYAFFISLYRGQFLTLISQTAWIEFLYNFIIFLAMLFVQTKHNQKHRSVFRL